MPLKSCKANKNDGYVDIASGSDLVCPNFSSFKYKDEKISNQEDAEEVGATDPEERLL